MSDPNMTEFYGRVARIQKMRAKGYGFEAPGALGRSFYYRPQTRRRSFVTPVLFLLLCCFMLKGVVYHAVGAESYSARVALLQAGTGVEPLGGWLMQPEPVTLFVASQIASVVTRLQ